MQKAKVPFGWMLEQRKPVGSWKSLLISGVTKAEGDFSYHDIVSVYHQETGQLLGKGKVRLGQSAVRDLLQSKKS